MKKYFIILAMVVFAFAGRPVEQLEINQMRQDVPQYTQAKLDLLGITKADLVHASQNDRDPGDTCEEALEMFEGINGATGLDQWFWWTAPSVGEVTITSCLDYQAEDTRFTVYDACGGNDVAFNDDLFGDCAYYSYASTVTFPVEPGVTYYLFSSDFWSPGAFDFDLTFTPLTAGCTNPLATNFDPDADIDDCSCTFDGCDWLDIEIMTSSFGSEVSWDITDPDGNVMISGGDYSSYTIYTDGTCLPPNTYSFNAYDAFGDGWNGGTFALSPYCGDPFLEDGLLSGDFGQWSFGWPLIEGCTDPLADNYDPLASIPCNGDNSCCTYDNCTWMRMEMWDAFGDGWNGNMAGFYDQGGNLIYSTGLPDGSYDSDSFCLPNAVRTTYDLIVDGGAWQGEVSWELYDDDASVMVLNGGAPYSGSFAVPTILGCTDPIAENYDPNATVDDGSCEYIWGCTDPIAENYNPDATMDDGSCEYIWGCTNPDALNYDPEATMDDGSCACINPPTDITADAGNHQVNLNWSVNPSCGDELMMGYDDGVLANAFYFYSPIEAGYAHGTRFDATTRDAFDVQAASVKILSDGDAYWPWPNDTHGPVRVMIFDDNGGVPGNVLWDEEVTAVDGWATVYPGLTGIAGAFYVITTHTEDWSIAGDPEGYGIDGSVDYPNHMVTMQAGTWSYGDVLSYGGDYMIAALVTYYGREEILSYNDETPPVMQSRVDPSVMAGTLSLPHTEIESIETHPVFTLPINNDRELISTTITRDGVWLADVPAGTNTYTDLGLSNMQTYSYTLQTNYTEGISDPSDPVLAIPVPGDPPQNLTLTDLGGAFLLEWEAAPGRVFDHYNVYRDGSLLGTTTELFMDDGEIVGGTEYCYTVTGDYGADGETFPSNEVCGIWVLDPPVGFTGEIVDDHAHLEWYEPGFIPPCYDDTIGALPFTASGNTTGMGDDFDVNASDGEDAVYRIDIVNRLVLDIELCGSSYDTKLQIFSDCDGTPTEYYNDDSCGLQSALYGVDLAVEGTYYIVVDGFGGSTGDYILNVTQSVREPSEPMLPEDAMALESAKSGMEISLADWHQPGTPVQTFSRALTGFNILKDGEVIDTVGPDVFSYDDYDIAAWITYCYSVVAVYDEGLSLPVPDVCLMFLGPPPNPPYNVTAVSTWDDASLMSGIEWSWEHDGGASCAEMGLNEDCAGTCFDDSYLDWVGDGFCDDGSFGLDFMCEAWNFDGGDCDLRQNDGAVKEPFGQPIGKTVVNLADGTVESSGIGRTEREVAFSIQFMYQDIPYEFITSDMFIEIIGFNPGDEVCANIFAIDYYGQYSDPSEESCGTSGAPEVCMYDPPINVNADAIARQGTMVTWEYPGYEPPIPGFGDTIDSAYPIDGIPFEDFGTTTDKTDDYDEACPYSGSTSPDAVYGWMNVPPGDYHADICDSDYDTKIYIYDGASNLLGCVDDSCNAPDGSPYRSDVFFTVTARTDIYIIIDGYGGLSGDYHFTLDTGLPLDYDPDPQPVKDDNPDEYIVNRECGVTQFNVYGEYSMTAGDCGDFTIDALPFTDSGTTLGMGDDWDVNFSDGEDVAYSFTTGGATSIDIELCDSYFDTKLEIFTADFECIGTTTGFYNDDDCNLQSALYGITPPAGTYYIVIDGFGGETGDYTINVTETIREASGPVDPYEAMAYEAQKSGVEVSISDWNPPVEHETIEHNGREFVYLGSTDQLSMEFPWLDDPSACFFVTADDQYADLGSPNESDPSETACVDDVDCPNMPGDVNGDADVNVLDIVLIVNYILNPAGSSFDDCQLLYADYNGDGSINVLDIVSLVGDILGRSAGNDASGIELLKSESGVSYTADGYVGGVQMTLTHGDDFSIELTENAYLADYATHGNETILIVIEPADGELFTSTGDFEISEVLAANSQGAMDVTTALTPDAFSLSNAYPNPFNPATTLELSLPADTRTLVQVYNLQGQVVATLVDGMLKAGYHEINWKAENVPSGMYLIKAAAGSNVETQKVMLLK